MFSKPPISHSNGSTSHTTSGGGGGGVGGGGLSNSSPSKISTLRSNFETPSSSSSSATPPTRGTSSPRGSPLSDSPTRSGVPSSSTSSTTTTITPGTGRTLPNPQGRPAPVPPGRGGPTRVVTASATAKPKPKPGATSTTSSSTTSSTSTSKPAPTTRPTITTTPASGGGGGLRPPPGQVKPNPVFTSTASATTASSTITNNSARAAAAAARSPHPSRVAPPPPRTSQQPTTPSASSTAAAAAAAGGGPLHLSSSRQRKLDHGIGSTQGKRPTMEDKHVALHKLPGHPHIAYFGIYDGHAGAEASEFVSETLHIEVNTKLSQEDDWKEAVIAAYSKVDEDFMEESEANMWESGTTVITAMIDLDKKQILLANLGDCRCILASGSNSSPFVKATALSEDHKPWVPAELERIEAAGCTVEEGRINGTHAMSRAIGDFELKQNISRDMKDQAISNLPEFREATIGSDELFLVLACDGLWDVMKNEEVAEWVYPRLYQSNDSLDKIATDLALHAVNIGSTDNVTCCIVTLP